MTGLDTKTKAHGVMHLRYSNTVPVVIYSPSVKCLSLRNALFSVCGCAAVLYFRYDHEVLVSLTKRPVFHCCVGSFARRTIEDAGETSQRHLNFTFKKYPRVSSHSKHAMVQWCDQLRAALRRMRCKTRFNYKKKSKNRNKPVCGFDTKQAKRHAHCLNVAHP